MTLLLKSCHVQFRLQMSENCTVKLTLSGQGFARLRFFGLQDWLSHFKSQISLHDSILTQLTCARVESNLTHDPSQYAYSMYSNFKQGLRDAVERICCCFSLNKFLTASGNSQGRVTPSGVSQEPSQSRILMSLRAV